MSGEGGSPVVTLKSWALSFVSNAKYEIFRTLIDTAGENTLQLSFPHPLQIGEKSVVYATASTDTNNTAVSCHISLTEFRDPDGI